MSRARRCRCGERIPTAGTAVVCRGCGRAVAGRAVGPALILAGLCVLSAAGGVGFGLHVRSRAPASAEAPVVPPPAARAPVENAPPERLPEPVPPPVAAPVAEPPPAPPRTPPAEGVLAPVTVGRYRVGESFDQEVSVSRRSALRVLGVGAPQAAEYTFTSRLTVETVGADEGLTVKQRVEGTRLVTCDPAARAELEDALRKARGATFTITVGPGGGVTGLKGPADAPRVAEGLDPGGAQTFRVWSLLDADGWKELAGLTFFQPGRPLAAGETWFRPLVHNWGPLGSWAGRTRYTAAGRRDGAERIDYAHELTYRPPPAGGGLPFRVVRAEFSAPTGGGVIRYDAARGRVESAEETFRVRGAVTVAVGGVETAAGVEEVQVFRLRLPTADARLLGDRPAGRRE
ncbi:MAG TPA: hypothetical protein VD866_23865 [Urbifossiella sp.]|nr:hypothetical protein [Urbifossiella sp.]